jgi:hypothetical protein
MKVLVFRKERSKLEIRKAHASAEGSGFMNPDAFEGI